MGKGDKKSKRGKIVNGSYGVRRLRKKSYKAEVKHSEGVAEKPVKEKREKPVVEVKESRVAREKVADRPVREVKPVVKAKKEKSS